MNKHASRTLRRTTSSGVPGLCDGSGEPTSSENVLDDRAVDFREALTTTLVQIT